MSWSDLYLEIKSRLQSEKQNYIFLDRVRNIAEFEKLVESLFVTPRVSSESGKRTH